MEGGLIHGVEIGFDKGIFERRDEVKERASWKQSGDAGVSEVDESAFELSLSSVDLRLDCTRLELISDCEEMVEFEPLFFKFNSTLTKDSTARFWQTKSSYRFPNRE